MEVRKAKTEEAEILTQISKRAFDTDVNVGGTEPDGPPEYDSIQWHQQMISGGNVFTILVD